MASHNLYTISYAYLLTQKYGTPKDTFCFEMLGRSDGFLTCVVEGHYPIFNFSKQALQELHRYRAVMFSPTFS